MEQSSAVIDKIRVQHLGERQGFFHYLLPLPKYPIDKGVRRHYVDKTIELVNALQKQYAGSHEFLLQLWKLNHDVSKEITKYGVGWIPVAGVAVWPHKPPPELWTKEEFEAFVPGEIPRPPISMVLRLKGKLKDLSNVLPVMGGVGAVVSAGIQGEPEEYYRRCETYFRTFVKEPLHLAFPFFFPLFDAATILALPADVTDQLLRPVNYYLRESAEDGGLLLLARSVLDPLFKQLDWIVERHV